MQSEALAQRRQFRHQSGLQHGVEARRDAPVQLGPVLGKQAERPHLERQFGPRLLLKSGNRLSRQPVDLQRALNALRVAWIEARRGGRIHQRQLCVQRRPASRRRFGVYPPADIGVGRRQCIQSLGEGAVVKHRAADKQGNPPPRQYFNDGAERIFTETPRRIAFGGIEKIDQMVRHGAAFFGRGLGGADVHAAIDLRRIDTHDLDRMPRGKLHRQVRFAARCGAQQRVGDAAARRMGDRHC